MRRRRRQVAAAAAAVVVGLSAWALTSGGRDSASPDRRPAAGGAVSPTGSASPSATTPARPSATPSSAARATATRTDVVSRGSGRLVAVPGSLEAPGRGVTTRVRVEVEDGVDVDPVAFADTVLTTLNDDRSWSHAGARTFARTDGDADVVVVLASPDTSQRMCRPLQTFGTLSCRSGQRAVLTSYRWLLGTPEFTDLEVYRQYVVNHEVGHVLGHGHEQCGGAGRLAPVMQQQTKRVAPCRPNPWPYP